MIEDRGTERRGVVAEMTILCSGHMVNCRILTGGVDAIVATCARTGNALMIKYACGKTVDVMTDATILAGR